MLEADKLTLSIWSVLVHVADWLCVLYYPYKKEFRSQNFIWDNMMQEIDQSR